MVVFPNAKLNLGLKVVRKRNDGYHDIQTVMLPIPLCDILEAVPSPDGMFRFNCSGISIPVPAEKNLCIRAYQLLNKDFGLPPQHLHLHKAIPSGAGLGGGSSDAAYTLKLLNELLRPGMDQEQMIEYASELGSDCAFFIKNTPSLAEGRGERISAISVELKGYYLAVVKPEVSVDTAAAYSWLKPQGREADIPGIINKGIRSWKKSLTNDFEVPVFKKHPEIGDIKDKLYHAGAVYASMSGSGSAVFGLFQPSSKKPVLSFPGCFFWDTCL